MSRLPNQFFYMDSGELFYIDEPVRDEPIFTEARDLLEKIVILEQTPEMFYLSLVFCIASQRQNFESPVDLTRYLLQHSRGRPVTSRLMDAEFVREAAVHNGVRWGSVKKENRIGPVYDYVNCYNRGMQGLVDDFREDPVKMRDKLAREVKWIGYKTASFWYLCLGGQELMTLDIHNYRQIAGLGVDVPAGFYDGKRRLNGKKELTTASKEDYVRIEQETLELLEGKISGAMATTLFWLAGAKAARKIKLHQRDLFEGETRLSFRSPYKK